MEIITGVERRRQWRDEEKLQILAELNEPGVKFSEIARRHDVSRGLLWQWRYAQRRGRLVAEAPSFMPLQVVPDLAAATPPGGSGPPPAAGPPAIEDARRTARVSGRGNTWAAMPAGCTPMPMPVTTRRPRRRAASRQRSRM
ncbi:transposase [Dankookia rubra]|uniref:transposase n=1 Tax=Dankookia rubra TaxID=1442381 RepID=UPI0019D592DE|nr:transposase [Dankookia rubra]